MIFNTIMVQLDLNVPAAPLLAFAKDLAKRFEADLIGFAAAEPYAMVPYDEGGMVTAKLMERAMQEIEARLKELKEEFLSVIGDTEHANWRSGVGDPTRLLAFNARAADLLVTSSLSPEASADYHRSIDAAALILSAGRPVLFAASDERRLGGQNVLIAWKDTREARRAVADAMPFLLNARDVLVATIAEGDQKLARESAADVVRFLLRHGVKARSDVLGIGANDPVEALADMARQAGADLIVAGGYGHSRAREWAFGGVTRSLLHDGSLHRLLSN
jgi:nucleotide-binding universal stress UspA family protein